MALFAERVLKNRLEQRGENRAPHIAFSCLIVEKEMAYAPPDTLPNTQ